MILEIFKKTGNIFLTALLVLLGLYAILIQFSSSLIQTIYKKMGWSIIIATKENSIYNILPIIILIVLIGLGIWYGYKYEKNSG